MSYVLIDQLSERESVDTVCSAFEAARSCYYAHRRQRSRIDAHRLALRSYVNNLFDQESKIGWQPQHSEHAS